VCYRRWGDEDGEVGGGGRGRRGRRRGSRVADQTRKEEAMSR
jgi:hypothetical protein